MIKVSDLRMSHEIFVIAGDLCGLLCQSECRQVKF